MTKTKPKTSPPRKRKYSAAQLARLARIAAAISEFSIEIPAWFIQKLKNDEGLFLTESPKGSGRWIASIAGLKTRPHSSRQQALRIWSNKARRTVAGAEG